MSLNWDLSLSGPCLRKPQRTKALVYWQSSDILLVQCEDGLERSGLVGEVPQGRREALFAKARDSEMGLFLQRTVVAPDTCTLHLEL